jgi:hypothetical protein
MDEVVCDWKSSEAARSALNLQLAYHAGNHSQSTASPESRTQVVHYQRIIEVGEVVLGYGCARVMSGCTYSFRNFTKNKLFRMSQLVVNLNVWILHGAKLT